MSEHRIAKICAILTSWCREPAQPRPEDEQIRRRSTVPDARMNLLLRFETEFGPRTIVAPGVPLRIASAIVQEMAYAGHFAEFTDQLTAVPMTERIRQRKAEAAFTPYPATLSASIAGVMQLKQASL